ncbi:CBL-interacting serine/threonine-protein kinase 23 [Orobanche minor]
MAGLDNFVRLWRCHRDLISVSSQLELFPDAEFCAYDEAMKYGAKVVLGDSSAGPENLLLDASGALKVSDFGLSALPQQVRPLASKRNRYQRQKSLMALEMESQHAKKGFIPTYNVT